MVPLGCFEFRGRPNVPRPQHRLEDLPDLVKIEAAAIKLGEHAENQRHRVQVPECRGAKSQLVYPSQYIFLGLNTIVFGYVDAPGSRCTGMRNTCKQPCEHSMSRGSTHATGSNLSVDSNASHKAGQQFCAIRFWEPGAQACCPSLPEQTFTGTSLLSHVLRSHGKLQSPRPAATRPELQRWPRSGAGPWVAGPARRAPHGATVH